MAKYDYQNYQSPGLKLKELNAKLSPELSFVLRKLFFLEKRIYNINKGAYLNSLLPEDDIKELLKSIPAVLKKLQEAEKILK